MNFESIIWGTASSCVPALMVLFAIVLILDLLRTFLSESGR